MKILESYYRKYFEQSTGPALAQLKFVLRVLQAQKFSRNNLTFLLTLETVLEQGDSKESLRSKLLPLLQAETEAEQSQAEGDSDSPEAQRVVQTLLGALDTLRSIQPDELPITGEGERWKAAMKAGTQALSELQELIEDWQIELEHHYNRAEDTLADLGILDEEEDLKDKEGESHE